MFRGSGHSVQIDGAATQTRNPDGTPGPGTYTIFLGGRTPLWGLAALLPLATIQIVQVLFVELGLAGSAVTMFAIASQGSGSTRRAIRAVLPWWLLALALCLLGAWLIFQPMQMRGTFSVGS